MPNHHSKNITDNLPVMLVNWKGGKHNTNQNLDDFLVKMRKTPEYKRQFNPRTGKLEIWFVMSNDNGHKITLWNTRGSCTIEIKCFCLGEPLSKECHEFNPFGFSSAVNGYLLTPDDLEQQRAFEKQEQDRKDALEKAHYSLPQTCGGVDTCEHCKDDKSHYEMLYCSGGT